MIICRRDLEKREIKKMIIHQIEKILEENENLENYSYCPDLDTFDLGFVVRKMGGYR